MYYRTVEPIEAENNREALAIGVLLFPWRASQPKIAQGCVAVSASPNGWGAMREVPLAKLEKSPAPRWQEFAQLMEYYFVGAVIPPNLIVGTPETLDADLNRVAHTYAKFTAGRILIPDKPGMGQFGETCIGNLGVTQGGRLDGSAHILFNVPTWGGPVKHPRTAHFKICDHASVTGANANPSRGWHPARCSKCGLDLTVDSSD